VATGLGFAFEIDSRVLALGFDPGPRMQSLPVGESVLDLDAVGHVHENPGLLVLRDAIRPCAVAVGPTMEESNSFGVACRCCANLK
jgi:hypothetical protein